MSFWEKLGNLFTGNLVKDVGDIIDNVVTTDEERARLKNAIAELFTKAEADAQEALTERQRIDMNSDSWLSKNIRPLALIFFLVMYSFFSIADGNIGTDFTINPNYVELLGQWGMVAVSFYFGSRGVEKVIETLGRYDMGFKKKDKNNGK